MTQPIIGKIMLSVTQGSRIYLRTEVPSAFGGTTNFILCVANTATCVHAAIVSRIMPALLITIVAIVRSGRRGGGRRGKREHSGAGNNGNFIHSHNTPTSRPGE